ncbi:hypothetical protein GP486_002410 [Trichoglossum hirsutum]|uniref:Ankyrin repeat protein n=1 Tax=Trichoglossum hirsutum TaxID=265104 RepID=A0A9P8LEU0_9PEZI|nr:hypothetical protein GP486_002410 [Trichoglossum hirsutum]
MTQASHNNRQCYTIDQAIDFLHDIMQKLDDVENFRLRVLQGNVESVEEWLTCMNQFREPVDQLAALRQGIIQDAWSEVIKSNITDGLERYLHMENGEFDFKSPSAETEAGRSKAFAVSSESRGYGENGGFSDSRQYNVPLLNRTYDCRHGRSLYTLYAVGLATVASPDIMKPGVIFPDFLATGRHTAHNPIRLILEESNILWPGLRVGALISIAVDKFEIDEGLLGPVSSPAAKACLRIYEVNQKLAEEVQRFVLPHDKKLALSYYRFDTDTPTSFGEYAVKNFIQTGVRKYVTSPQGATKCAIAANILKEDNFPTAPEDQVALASLASLLHALVVAGYTHEAAIVTDVISNFILCEAVSGEDGSFRKAAIATEAEKLGARIHRMHEAYEDGHTNELPDDLRSEGAMLLGLMAFGDSAKGEPRPPGDLQTLSDYAAGAYYFLTVLRRGDSSEMEEPRCRILLRQLWELLNAPPEITQQSIGRMESILELATLAALCDAATTQALRGFKGLTHNGSLIRHVHGVLLNTSLVGVSQKILGPIANFLAICIHMDSWSLSRDDSIIQLINAGSTKAEEIWSLINLAVERHRLENRLPTHDSPHPDIISVCEAFLERHTRAWSTQSSEILALSIQNGFFRLLWKYLCGEALTTGTQAAIGARSRQGNFESNGETVLHQVARLGFPYIMKMIIECFGMVHSKDIVNRPNNQGQTPLHLACMHRAPKEIFRLLVILGADVNTRCHQGRTALHYCFPNQGALPSVYEDVISMISEHSLPTITPLDRPQVYTQGACKPVEPRVYDFRVIISQLLSRHADMSITDHEAMTPLHTAAKYGWGDNLDIFFRLEGGNAERLQSTCLRLRDNAGLTILNHTRKSEIKEGMDRGEDIITGEMSKRGMGIPPTSAYDLWSLRPQWSKVQIGKPRTPVQDETTQSSYYIPRATPSPQPPARFPPPLVYQDPDVGSSVKSPAVSYELRTEPPPNATIKISPPPPMYNDPSHLQGIQRKPLPAETMTDGTESKQKSGFLKKFRKGK